MTFSGWPSACQLHYTTMCMWHWHSVNKVSSGTPETQNRCVQVVRVLNCQKNDSVSISVLLCFFLPLCYGSNQVMRVKGRRRTRSESLLLWLGQYAPRIEGFCPRSAWCFQLFQAFSRQHLSHALSQKPPTRKTFTDICRIVICSKSDKQKFWVDISVIEQFSTKSRKIEMARPLKIKYRPIT